MLKFADDIEVFRVIRDEKGQNVLQSDLDKLVEWSERWQMKLNFAKCKSLHIGCISSKRKYEMKGHKLINLLKLAKKRILEFI